MNIQIGQVFEIDGECIIVKKILPSKIVFTENKKDVSYYMIDFIFLLKKGRMKDMGLLDGCSHAKFMLNVIGNF